MKKLTDLALSILEDRYLWKDKNGRVIETPEQMFRRVAHFVASGEEKPENFKKYEEEFFNIMSNLDFLPNSPTLMNAGRPFPHGQLSACFVVDVPDSMEGICGALRKQMLIHKSGGGTGFNFSKLRAEGSQVNSTNGCASGPVSFMRLFDLSTDIVQQGGMRRGANMAVLNVDHPDIRKFIHCKDKDGDIKNFNLSVGLTDEFMEKATGHGNTPEYRLLMEIAESAWRTGDPGVVFLDTMERANPTPELGKLDATNPCLRGTMRVLTRLGYMPIGQLAEEHFIGAVWNGYEWVIVEPRCTGHNQKMLRVTFSNGSVLDCTPYHKFVLNNNERVEAQNLKVGDKLCKFELPVIENQEHDCDPPLRYCEGFYVGDGDRRRNDETDTHVSLYGDKINLLPLFKQYYTSTRKEHERLVLTLDAEASPWDKFFVPDCAYPVADRLAWLAGFIDSDGCRNSAEGSISLSASNKELLQRVKDMLATLGTPSTLSKGRDAGKRLMPDGHGGQKLYNHREEWRLLISAWYVQKLVKLGLKTYRVDISGNPNRNAARLISVVSVEPCEDAECVYCLTEPRRHMFVAEGVSTGNCGEQPLLPNEACNLGSINLVNMLKKDARGRYVIDFDKLKRTVHIAVRFLSDVIEVNQYPLPEIEEAVRKTRKIGLGVMGYAHMLYYLGIPYDSTVALNTLEQIMRTIKVAARCYAEQVLNDRPKHTALTCIAPTGTLSLIAGVSSGIEPVFALHHERTVLDHSGGSHTVTIYDSAYEDIVTNDLLSWLSPDEQENVYKTAYTVSPYWHIATQAVAQKYCDAGVSKTVNMPNTATVADIFEVYVHAWESGCKGTTVYRDGSKTSQVLKCPECVI